MKKVTMLFQKTYAFFFSFLPFLFVVYTVSNIFYLSLISFFPALIVSTYQIVLAHILCFILSLLIGYKYRAFFSIPNTDYHSTLLLIPILIIVFIRFAMIYPTLDDVAVHFMYGDLANTIWNNTNFVPLEFLTYFYLVLDMNYTPFLYTIGIRLTILLFNIVSTLWLFSIFQRIKHLTNTAFQRLLLDILFLITPFIPHIMAILGTLMIDYATIPIGLETIYLLLQKGKDKTFAAHMTIILILSKLSPSTFVILPIAYLLFQNRKKIRWIEVAIFVCISGSYFVRQYIETGSPLFGLYNAVFQSPLYPLSNFSNPLFGPRGMIEFVFWPIIAQFTSRYAEGIVSQFAQIFFAPIPILGYVVSFFLFIKKKSILYSLFFISYMLWSYLAGYARYYELLNIMALLFFILEIKRVPKLEKMAKSYGALVTIIVAILIFSSMKTDFSWRPYPSVATPGATNYFLAVYKEGLSYLGKDTIPAIAKEYKEMFQGYDATVTAYRGASTFVSYMGQKNGVRMINGTYIGQDGLILSSKKVSSQIKENLAFVASADRVLLLADSGFVVIIPSLSISQSHTCTALKQGKKLPEFQREYYFQDVSVYECIRNK